MLPAMSEPSTAADGIREATTDAEISACWPVMHQLRPHIDAAAWLPRVQRQMAGGYRLAFRQAAGAVRAVAGFRLGENLAWGRHLYVDDLVSDAAERSHGHGGALLAWLVALARQQGCAQFHLDSGVQRFGAHRFYLRHGLDITSHHFCLRL